MKKIYFSICLLLLIILVGLFSSCNPNSTEATTNTDTSENVGTDNSNVEQHKHDFVETIVNPSCLEKGYTIHSCSCGESYIDTYVSALDHKFTNYVSDGNATYESDGTKTAICDRVGCNAMDTILEEGSKLKLPYSVGFVYTENNDGNSYTLSSIGTCSDSDIIIPEEYNEKKVTIIGKEAFSGKTITSVELPNTIVTIEDSAFSRCLYLESVTIGNGVKTIGNNAFYYCWNLKSIFMRNGVATIGEKAFTGCDALEKVYIENIEDWCKITFAESSSNPLSYAENLYLNGTLVESLAIPNSITEINEYAFYSASITSVTIPENIYTIGDYAFANCYLLTEINFNAVSMNDTEYKNNILLKAGRNGNGIKVNINKNVKSIPRYLFNSGRYTTSYDTEAPLIKTVEFQKNSVCKSIYSSYFNGCKTLESINIPQSVAFISKGAFSSCSSLTSVEFEKIYPWYYTASSNPTSKPSFYISNLDNASTTARYLTDEYCDYNWFLYRNLSLEEFVAPTFDETEWLPFSLLKNERYEISTGSGKLTITNVDCPNLKYVFTGYPSSLSSGTVYELNYNGVIVKMKWISNNSSYVYDGCHFSYTDLVKIGMIQSPKLK